MVGTNVGDGESAATGAYALGRSLAERERLALQERVIGASTGRFFTVAGIRAGMRVLDVGSGVGDVAMRVARTVGPTGSVVGIDIDESSIATARDRAAESGLANVDFVVGDATSTDVTSGFDAVVGRLVLMHVPDPVAVLRRVARVVNRGGLVAFQEAHLDSPWLSFPASASLERVQRLRDLALRGGQPVNRHMGLALRETFVSAGLPAPDVEAALVVGGGPEWRGFELFEATVTSLLPGWRRLGIDGADQFESEGLAARLREELGAHGLLTLYPLVGAWTRLHE